MKVLLRWTLGALLLGSLCVSSTARAQFFVLENPMIGEEAPAFTLKTVGGKAMSFADFRAGQPALVFFWATWCPHCRTQLKDLNAHQTQMEGKGIKIVLVDLGESEAMVKSYLEKNKITMTTFLDATSKVAEDYNVIGLPTFFFVNSEGTIRAVEHTIPDNYEELLKS